MSDSLPNVTLPSGESVPAFGQGTWHMGEGGGRADEVAALKLGIELGLTLIDTAEMYGSGIAEVAAHEEFLPPAGFTVIDERVYGAARLVFLRRASEATGGKR